MANIADSNQLVLKKPTDLDLHCLQRQGHAGSAGQWLNSAGLQSAVGSIPDCRSREPQLGHITVMKIDHEIYLWSFFPLLLNQEQQ